MRIAYVDGFKIRQTLDTDFGAIHSHSTEPTQYSPKFYIPKGETWIDHRFKKETDFLLKEDAWYKSITKNYHLARKLRMESLRKSGKPPAFIRRTLRKDGLKICYVDGSVIRQHLDFEFVCGGHDLVYDYIPAKTIWIDVTMDPRDLPPTLLHEMTEREIMAKGTAYESAHEFATATEKLMRRTHGGIYPGDPGYPFGSTHEQFVKKYVKKYETLKG